MINIKQLDRLVLKITRLKDHYSNFLVKKEEEQEVLLNGSPIKKGSQWGEDFGYGLFTFLYQSKFENPHIFINDGGVEHLLLADGKPFGMTDYLPNGKDDIFRLHKFVSLSEVKRGSEITVESYCSHTFYGTMPFEGKQTFSVNGYRPQRVFDRISVVEIDGSVKRFIDLSAVLLSYFRCMKDGDVRKIYAYQAYERLFDMLSVMPHETPCSSRLDEACEVMEQFILSLKSFGYEKEPYVAVIGHSHLDTAWLWTVEESKHKAARTAANAVTLLKQYPEYKFIMSSAVHLDWIRRDHPQLFEDIRELVKKGQFEPNGGSWVECECNLTDGESIVRQFLKGNIFLKKYFDYKADVFWLPDTFGYSAALPQILKGCNIPYFLTTKLSWNDTNKFPYESFRWQGIDGSEVTVHFNTTQSKADPEFITSRLDKRMNKHLSKNVLIAYGYGDGGGGPERSMVEEAIITQRSYPYATVEHTTVSQFMKRLEKEELPVYRGELYLELHRGTLTTNHDIKKLNRTLESKLKDLDLIAVGFNDVKLKELADECYDVLMVNQFHDILPGTCIHEAHAVAVKENGEALARIERQFDGDQYFNTLGWSRREVLQSEDGEQSYVDLDGKTVSVAEFDFKPYAYGKRIAAKESEAFTVAGESITTPYYNVIMKDGVITSLIYNGRQIAEGGLNFIRAYEDVPYLWDNWDVDADYTRKPISVEVLSSEVVSLGKLQLRIRTVYKINDGGVLTQDTVFYSNSKRIDFESKLDWHGSHKLVRAEFETSVYSPYFKSEIQFGYIQRPTTRNTSEEQAKYEVCNHKWSDLSEPRFGVALINDCKYGVSCEGKKMGLTLLKSGKRPDVVGEIGVKYFNYALLPHDGGFCAKSVTLPAYNFNRKPVCLSGRVSIPVKGVDSDNVIVESIKIAENGQATVLRLYECEGSYTGCKLKLSKEYDVYLCNLLEEDETYLCRSSEVELEFGHFEIKTLLLKPAK